MDFPLYFLKVMLLRQGSIVEIDYGFFRVFGPYFIGKSLGTSKILKFGLWSLIPHPYLWVRGVHWHPLRPHLTPGCPLTPLNLLKVPTKIT